MPEHRPAGLSSALARIALRALDRVYACGEADDPDLGRNIAHYRARQRLLRIVRARPWVIPPGDAAAIEGKVAVVDASGDPHVLEAQLRWFTDELFRYLDQGQSLDRQVVRVPVGSIERRPQQAGRRRDARRQRGTPAQFPSPGAAAGGAGLRDRLHAR